MTFVGGVITQNVHQLKFSVSGTITRPQIASMVRDWTHSPLILSYYFEVISLRTKLKFMKFQKHEKWPTA
jgi:hypothetical protein